MSDPQGIISYPGILDPLSCEFTLSHGITPGVCTVECLPQQSAPMKNGTLKFTFGGTTISFPGARIDNLQMQLNESGQKGTFAIFDRRWKWRYGKISGHYNLYNAAGELITGKEVFINLPQQVTPTSGSTPQTSTVSSTEKTPQELCTLCLKAMGETGYDVSQVADYARPEVHWSSTNSAQALAQLCDELGLRVVLKLNNTVSIVPIGVGALLPNNGSEMNISYGIDPPDGPDSIEVVGGPTIYQAKFMLEAVGLDLDGKWKRLDDLSYKPSAGWGEESPDYFPTLAGPPPSSSTFDIENKKLDLAQQTVWKCYRITGFATLGTATLDLTQFGIPQIKSLAQVLPLGDALAAVSFDLVLGDSTNTAPLVTGIYFEKELTASNTANKSSPYRGGFSILGDLGIVQFSEAVYQYDSNANYVAADITLETSFSVKDFDTREPERFTRERTINQGGGTKPQILLREDIVKTVIVQYAASTLYSRNPFAFSDNVTIDKLDIQADYQIDAALLEYQTDISGDVGYIGLIKIDPDGAIQQVSWSIPEDGGCTTRASRNSEHHLYVLPYKERRRREKLAKIDAFVKASEPQAFKNRRPNFGRLL